MKKAYAGALLLLLLSVTVLDVKAQSAPVEKLQVPGLVQSVEILRDRWGISHIYAQNESDLFFAQGYNVARTNKVRSEEAVITYPFEPLISIRRSRVEPSHAAR